MKVVKGDSESNASKIPVTVMVKTKGDLPPKPAYTKKQKKLIRHVLNDLLSNVRGFLYTDPKEIGVYQTFIVDDKNKEEIIRKYENTTITNHN